MVAIQVAHFTKRYRVFTRASGFFPAFRSLFFRSYTDICAVDAISFSIAPGELVGFIGPNGAGKTTTLKCLSGLLYPTDGDIKVLGYRPIERDHAFLQHIGLVMGQKNQLWWDLPAMDTFLLNKEIYGLSQQTFQRNLEELVTLLAVEDLLATPVRQLSLGQRMKMELIAALVHKPKVLFLDEPTIGLDVVMQKAMREFITTYNQKHGATILLTSHYVKDVAHICKRIIVINHGRIIYDGDIATLRHTYAPFKLVTIRMQKKIPKKDIERFGVIKEYTSEKILLQVDKKKSRSVTATILAQLPIDDLNIGEPELEDIIREVFSHAS